MRTYSELSELSNYIDRFNYLKCDGEVGSITFGSQRMLNQILYRSVDWRRIRSKAIARDFGCDMGHPDYPIRGEIIVHHMNPITIDDVIRRNSIVFDLEYLICVSKDTHNAIHYGQVDQLEKHIYVPREPNDTIPWKGG